jgi:hypothetical protein
VGRIGRRGSVVAAGSNSSRAVPSVAAEGREPGERVPAAGGSGIAAAEGEHWTGGKSDWSSRWLARKGQRRRREGCRSKKIETVLKQEPRLRKEGR